MKQFVQNLCLYTYFYADKITFVTITELIRQFRPESTIDDREITLSSRKSSPSRFEKLYLQLYF